METPSSGSPPLPFVQERQVLWRQGLPDWLQNTIEDLPTIIATGSGKGGVGKSLLSANIAMNLAGQGKTRLSGRPRSGWC